MKNENAEPLFKRQEENAVKSTETKLFPFLCILFAHYGVFYLVFEVMLPWAKGYVQG